LMPAFREYTAPVRDETADEAANYSKSLARREGLEPPTLRFEVRSRPERKR
jgi:hypothetical protein